MIATAKKSTSKPTAVTPAVGYLRMSTDRQDKSIGEQRTEIEKLAARDGFTIIRWYEDHGISGDKTQKREQFKRMIADAARGEFTTIIVWDQDRFGRFDSLEAGRWIHPLREAGVTLVTVTEGPIDWDGSTGRMMYGIKQEGKHQFLIDISRNTLRGYIKMAQSGGRNGRPAYGYDRMLIDDKGDHRLRVKAGEKVPKPLGWHSIYVPGDKIRVDAVKWMFKTYAATTTSLRRLAADLNTRGIPSPTGSPWNGVMVRGILKNAIYRGDSVWGLRSTGKYHRAVGTDIERVNGRKVARQQRHAEADCIVKANNHEALVDRKTWAKVQKKLWDNKSLTTPRTDDVYLLTGLCRCGHCGTVMHGRTDRRSSTDKVKAPRVYLCSSYARRGTASGCNMHKIDEARMTRLLLAKLQEFLFAGGSREAIEARLRKMVLAEQADEPNEAEQTQGRLAELDAQIDQAADRLLKAPSDLTDILAPKLTAMRQEREQLAATLSRKPKKGHQVNVDAEVKRATDKLWTLAKEFQKAKPEDIKDLLRQLVAKVDLYFETKRTSKRASSRCTRGIIELNNDPSLFGLNSLKSMCAAADELRAKYG